MQNELDLFNHVVIIVGMKLETYLKKNGIRPGQFAKKAGMSAMAVSRYLRGRRPSFSGLVKIEKATDGQVTMKDFIKATVKKK